MFLPISTPSADRARATGSRLGLRGLTWRVALVPPSDDLRERTEAFIRETYERAFRARGLMVPPVVIALFDAANRPLCAAGLRTAHGGFFSEAYLDTPIEGALSERFGKPVDRNSVFEITTLASGDVKACLYFLHRIALWGKGAGFESSFFTATARVRRLLFLLEVPILELCRAEPSRIADSSKWGTYYDHDPRVCAVSGEWLYCDKSRRGGSSPNA